MIDYRDYPFIADLNEVLKRYPGLSLETLLETCLSTVRESALALIESIVAENVFLDLDASIEEHVLIYYSVLLGVKALGDKRLMHRVAHIYSKRARDKLVKEPVENLIIIAKALGLDVKAVSNSIKIPLKIAKTSVVSIEKPFAIPLKSYLKIIVGRLSQDPKYSLVNQIVSNGLVYLDRETLIRLLEEKIYKFIIESFERTELDVVKIERFVEDVKGILDKHGWYKEKIGLDHETSVFIRDALPPCVAKLMERLFNGENLSHQERFVIASFLVSIGLSVDKVLEFFKHAPDYNEKIARYQVEHIAGLRGSRKKYLPYGCETMKTLSLCPKNDYCDVNTKNPLGVYRLNLGKTRRSVRVNGEETNRDSI